MGSDTTYSTRGWAHPKISRKKRVLSNSFCTPKEEPQIGLHKKLGLYIKKQNKMIAVLKSAEWDILQFLPLLTKMALARSYIYMHICPPHKIGLSQYVIVLWIIIVWYMIWKWHCISWYSLTKVGTKNHVVYKINLNHNKWLRTKSCLKNSECIT